MPMSPVAQMRAFFAGLGLFMTTLVFCYLNSTTNSATLSMVFLGGIYVCGLACAAKWASATGVESKATEWADKLASFVPWVAAVADVYQAMHFTRDGLDGFMSGFAGFALIFLVCFGAVDSIMSIIGKKTQQANEALHEVQRRASNVSQAMRG